MDSQSVAKFSVLLNEAITKPGILSSAYSAFYNYSLGNQLFAYWQCAQRNIKAGPIATFQGWKEKGRFVRKGEKAISLCMPVTVKGKRENEDGETKEFAFSRFIFRPNWFVLEQTDGEEFHAEVKTPEWDSAKALGTLGISEVPFDCTDGNVQGYAQRGNTIAINPLAALPHKTRFHELAHIVLGHTAESTLTDSERTLRDIREVEAESVAYILCSLLGLPGQDESRGYIQHWLAGNEINERNAQRIFAAANKIMQAGK